MGYCDNIEKCLLIYVNGVYTLFSTLLTFSGVWIILDERSLDRVHLDNISDFRLAIGIVFTVFGLISIVLHSIGLWGAYRGIRFLLKLYAYIIVVCTALGFISTIFNHNIVDVDEAVRFESSFKNFTIDDNAHRCLDAHTIQKTFRCCGYYGPEDFQANGTYPWSCCGSVGESCSTPTYKEGCLSKARRVLTTFVIVANVMKLAGTVINLICIIAAFRLVSKLEKKLASTSTYVKM